MSESDLKKAAVAYANKPRVTHSEQAAYVDGALHLLERAEQWCKGISEIEPRIKQGTMMQANALLTFLKSYCGREGV